MARRVTKDPREKLNANGIDRPLNSEGKLMYYVLLSGLKPSGKVKQWSVEARISSTMSATGQTEREALRNLLLKIRSGGGEASFNRLKVWRAEWKPVPDHLKSFDSMDG